MKSVSRKIISFLTVFILSVVCVSHGYAADTKNYGNIFVYFGIEDEADNNADPLSVSIEQFQSHLNLIAAYHLKPVAMTDFIKNLNAPPAEKLIALTFDNPSHATINYLLPLIKKFQTPVTLFITTDNADYNSGDNLSNNLSWDDLKSLAKNPLIDVELLGKNYKSLAGLPDDARAQDLNAALARFEEKLNRRARVFAYAYGDYDSKLVQILKERKFDAAVAMQSGSATAEQIFALPRFSMTDRYGDDERFRGAAKSEPLMVKDVIPADTLAMQNPPAIGFTLKDQTIKPQQLRCFSNADQKLRTEILGDRIELRYPAKITPGRIRVNCTSTVKDEDGNQHLKWWGINVLIK